MMRVEQIRKAGLSTPVNLSLILHDLTTSMLLRAAWGKTRIKNMPELLAGVRIGVAQSSGFTLPDLFPTWGSALAAVTGLKRTFESIHKTIDSVFEEVIEERMCARAENVKTGAENVDENLVDVLIGMQEKGDSVFPIDKPRIKAFLLVSATSTFYFLALLVPSRLTVACRTRWRLGRGRRGRRWSGPCRS